MDALTPYLVDGIKIHIF